MVISIPDSLSTFVAGRVLAGAYPNADAFIAELLQNEAEVMAQVENGQPLPVDGHFERRLGALLDEAAVSGDYEEATPDEFDAMEAEAQAVLARRHPNP